MLVFRKYRNALIITLAAKPRSNAGGSSLCDQPLPHFLPHAPPFPPSRSSFSFSYPSPTSLTFSHFLPYISFTPFLILPYCYLTPSLTPLSLFHSFSHTLPHYLLYPSIIPSFNPFLTSSLIQSPWRLWTVSFRLISKFLFPYLSIHLCMSVYCLSLYLCLSVCLPVSLYLYLILFLFLLNKVFELITPCQLKSFCILTEISIIPYS